MFSAIAPRYDLLNHLLSLNVDRRWRRLAVDRLAWDTRPAGRYLDVCTGTYDLALELAHRPGFAGNIVAVDFSLSMLRQGMSKIDGSPIAPVCGDALQLPLPSERFDGVMVAFGVRNLANIDAGLREILRLLSPGARLVILDFAMPARPLFRKLYRAYFTRVLPFIGRLISKHSFAYNYLPESVLEFSSPVELSTRMTAAGFTDVKWKPTSGGTVCIWWGVRDRQQDGHRCDQEMA
jgi:demethylmenaquinone methyltransferase/2-methoxy-6-polyprenyl-1,4-benzoquinol methylase